MLFSPAGVIADDVLRDLVDAEPAGRVVVVVTDDRELAATYATPARGSWRPGRWPAPPEPAAAWISRLSVVAVTVSRHDDANRLRHLRGARAGLPRLRGDRAAGAAPELTIDDDERRALDVLAEGGLVPPLRLVRPVAGPEVESA